MTATLPIHPWPIHLLNPSIPTDLDRVDVRPNQRMLEIGTGAGQITVRLAHFTRSTEGMGGPAERWGTQTSASVMLAASRWRSINVMPPASPRWGFNPRDVRGIRLNLL